MEPKPFIEGKTVDLRPLSLEDVNDTYVNWLNDAEVCAYNSHHVYPYTRELAIEYVTRVRSQKNDLVLAIVEKGSGKHIGKYFPAEPAPHQPQRRVRRHPRG